MDKIGVGIVGAGTGGWASISHVPVLQALPDYELRAISTSRAETAAAASEQYGVGAAYAAYRDLIAHPGVDLVVVAVKVPLHHEVITAALDAGKMVYSEWPLARNLAEAADLAERAERAGVRTVIGLQGRCAPEVRYARDLIGQGYIGSVLGTTMVGSAMAWGDKVALRGNAYWFDRDNGATPLTSAAMHALDALHATLGDFSSLTAHLMSSRTEAAVVEDGGVVPFTVPDQIAVAGTLVGDVAASVFYRGGASRGDNFHWEINGADGDLVLSSPAWGNMQVAELTLAGGRGDDSGVAALAVPEHYTAELPGTLSRQASGVAALYTQFAADLRDGTDSTPGFAHALTRHQEIDAVERASRTGERQELPLSR
ncbi:Predicted dehydrogenase [Streptomyces sp. DvalAA-14]|uniref:Gfo/Idh/MocA family protein n=1 Tax=unclassified Streptomyces TaxID=2593676 RepID=UPI00081B3F9F|nr:MULTISPECIES: Gfo/Idh/MocA family oxidoreductase [unclassified Streptomyces]MYS22281.1 Gfo/Idh/MocA family oxidoreductase [Streptomyces sp. SID4948]SCE12783.1 Predicted dehydrogenase [Streptomyces sp. DvalAA-14]